MPIKKPWYASRMIWANVVGLAAASATAAGLDVGLDGETQASIVTGILAFVNVVLRFRTQTAIGRA